MIKYLSKRKLYDIRVVYKYISVHVPSHNLFEDRIAKKTYLDINQVIIHVKGKKFIFVKSRDDGSITRNEIMF